MGEEWRSRFYEDLDVGDVYRSRFGRTVTETDNLLFTALTMNTNQLHFSAAYSEKTRWGRILVNSSFTVALLTGMSVADVTEHDVPISRAKVVPVSRQMTKVRNRGEGVEGRMAGRRHVGIGRARMMQVDRRIVGERRAIVDVGDEFAISIREEDRMVRDLRKVAPQSEMHHEQAGRETLATER